MSDEVVKSEEIVPKDEDVKENEDTLKKSEEDTASEKKENGDSKEEEEDPKDISNDNTSALDLKLDTTEDSLKDEADEEHTEGSMEEESMEEESVEESKDEKEAPTKKKADKKSTEVKAKRDRKKVERLVLETKKEELEITGRGIPLGEIPYVEKMILKHSPDDLRILHRIAFSRPGTTIEIRRNLKKFSGFSFKPEDAAYERKKHNLEKIVMAELKKIALILGLEKKGNKTEVTERIFTFLLKPQDLGKVVPGRKPKNKGKGKGQKRPRKSKEKSTKSAVKGNKDEDVEESGEDDEEEEDDDEENEEEEEENESEEEVVEEVKPKKQLKKTPAKKVPTPRTPKAKNATPKVKNSTPATAKKSVKKRPKAESSESGDDSEHEPLAKKSKKAPTDAEIKAYIKKSLEKANLEEVTMKKICQQVYDNYPKHDLSHKKEFIKSTVKSILS